jgi:hypothetical protein
MKIPPASPAIAAMGERGIRPAEWAESYGDQTERDHDTLCEAIRRGLIQADIQPDDGS